jgi:VPDSG-CTERM motif
MKIKNILIAVAVLMSAALTFSAKAAFTLDPSLTFLGAVAKIGSNSPDANLAALTSIGIDTTGFVLEADFSNLSSPVSDTAGCFIVVHYGTGTGGSNPGGSLEFFLVNAGFTSDTLPQFGNVGGPDPFGHGGISSAREFCPAGVPDGGTTAMLLGAGLSGLGLVRRFLKR